MGTAVSDFTKNLQKKTMYLSASFEDESPLEARLTYLFEDNFDDEEDNNHNDKDEFNNEEDEDDEDDLLTDEEDDRDSHVGEETNLHQQIEEIIEQYNSDHIEILDS